MKIVRVQRSRKRVIAEDDLVRITTRVRPERHKICEKIWQYDIVLAGLALRAAVNPRGYLLEKLRRAGEALADELNLPSLPTS